MVSRNHTQLLGADMQGLTEKATLVIERCSSLSCGADNSWEWIWQKCMRSMRWNWNATCSLKTVCL